MWLRSKRLVWFKGGDHWTRFWVGIRVNIDGWFRGRKDLLAGLMEMKCLSTVYRRGKVTIYMDGAGTFGMISWHF